MFKAIILGLVQGLTEFLPVSSSGHLVIVPYLLSWESPSLGTEVALHLGTLIAVILYFRGDLYWLITRSMGRGATVEGEIEKARRTVGLLAISSVPAAIFGFVIEPMMESTFAGDPRWAGGFLLVTSATLYAAEFLRRRRAAKALGVAPDRSLTADVGRDEGSLTPLDAAVIGSAQAAALFPGFSRSGATIAAGMARGLSRGAAARYSFLMSIPVILGAGAYTAKDLIGSDAHLIFTPGQLLVGMAVAAVSGFWAIRYLLRLVSGDDLTGFARYTALLGVLTLVGYIWIGPPSTI